MHIYLSEPVPRQPPRAEDDRANGDVRPKYVPVGFPSEEMSIGGISGVKHGADSGRGEERSATRPDA